MALSFLAFILIRARIDERNREIDDASRMLEPVLHSWLVLDADISRIKLTLRALRPYAALRSLSRLAAQQVPLELQRQLAEELRREEWIQKTCKRAGSLLWWRRFDAARLLTVVAVKEDEPVISRLLGDRSPAVRLVAIDAAARLGGDVLVARMLETVTQRQDAVQTYQVAAMARQPLAVASELVRRLQSDAGPEALTPWIDTAGALAVPEVLVHVRKLAAHPAAEVRVRVARALRRLSDQDTPPVLIQLLQDSDWRVRAQAARALGALRCVSATPHLARAVRDRSWWVRYRSALALAQIGGTGNDALANLRVCDDAMARDMAALVSGLSAAAVVEMSEV
jgi:HEAT repeat protein